MKNEIKKNGINRNFLIAIIPIMLIMLVVGGIFGVLLSKHFATANIKTKKTVTALVNTSNLAKTDSNENAIAKRTYLEILEYVDDFPNDISAQPYVSNLTKIKIVREDMKKLQNGEINKIEYYDDISSLIVTLDEKNSFNTVLAIHTDELDYSIDTKDVSLYCHNGKLLLCTRKNQSRILQAYFLTKNKYGAEICEEINTNIDLCGVSINEEDEVLQDGYETYNFSLVRRKKSFCFYQYGKLLKTVEFTGGDIINSVFSDGYILDSNNDIYYFYYNSDSNSPDMKFLKAASNIDKIVDDSVILEYESDTWPSADDFFLNDWFNFPLYEKDGKMYVTSSDCWGEYNFGLKNCGERKRNQINMDIIDEEIYCLDEAKVKYYEFEAGSMSTCFYIKYYYVFDNNIIIDHCVVYQTPESLKGKLLELDGKIISNDELDDILSLVEK